MEKSKITSEVVDALINRENFSISLRKKKKAQILDDKRKKNPHCYNYIEADEIEDKIRKLLPPHLQSSE